MEEPGKQDNELDDLPMAGEIGDNPFGDSDLGDIGFAPDDGALDLDSMDSLDLDGIDLGDGSDAGESFDPGQPGDELSGDFNLDFSAEDSPENPGVDLDGGQAPEAASFEDSLDNDSFDEVPALTDDLSFDDFSEAVPGEGLDESLDLDLSDEGIQEEADLDLPEVDADEDASVTGTSFFDESDDETVALSEDELEDILGHTDEAFFEDFGESEATADEVVADFPEDSAALDTEDGRLELSDVRSGDELVPEPELEPIHPQGSDLDPASPEYHETLDAVAPQNELEELGFDDFDSADADGMEAGDETVTAFSDEELELALDLDDAAAETSPVPGFLDDGDDDEPIALSEDELDNIMGDVEPAAAEPGEHLTNDDLSDDMPGDMSGDMTDAFDGDALDFDTPSEEEDENITLSDDELSQVLLDADSDEESAGNPDMAGGDAPDFEDVLDEDLPAPPSLSSLDMDDDEPIALTAEELGNIVSEVETDEIVEATGFEPDADDLDFLEPDDSTTSAEMFLEEDTDLVTDESLDDFSPDLAGFENTEEEGPVALSDSELGSILEDTDTETVSATGQTPPPDDDDFDLGMDSAAADEFADGNVIVLDEYEDEGAGPVVEGPPEPEMEEAPAAAASGLASRAEQLADEANLDREELRTMISYLDGLFDALPDDAVRQFSQSSYFDLYKKIMTELGL